VGAQEAGSRGWECFAKGPGFTPLSPWHPWRVAGAQLPLLSVCRAAHSHIRARSV